MSFSEFTSQRPHAPDNNYFKMLRLYLFTQGRGVKYEYDLILVYNNMTYNNKLSAITFFVSVLDCGKFPFTYINKE